MRAEHRLDGWIAKVDTFFGRFDTCKGSIWGEHLLKEIRIVITSFNTYISEVIFLASKVNKEGGKLRKNEMISYFLRL